MERSSLPSKDAIIEKIDNLIMTAPLCEECSKTMPTYHHGICTWFTRNEPYEE